MHSSTHENVVCISHMLFSSIIYSTEILVVCWPLLCDAWVALVYVQEAQVNFDIFLIKLDDEREQRFLLSHVTIGCIQQSNCFQEAVVIQRMTFLVIFGEAGIRHLISGQNLKESICSVATFFLPLHRLFPSSSHLLLPHFLFPGSHPLFVQLSLTDFSSFVFFYFVCACTCVCVCVCNGSIVPMTASGITEVKLPTYE